MGKFSHVFFESPVVLVKNFSVTLESDNSGDSPGWYADSVAVDIQLPNNRSFHYWFPVHRWIGGSSPTSFTFNESDDLQVYTFTVATGDEECFHRSGTNSNILVKACDVNDKCVTFLLDKDNHDDFEAGSVSTYTIVTKEKMANLKSLTLHNSWIDQDNPGWYVNDVIYTHASFPEDIGHSTLRDGQTFMFRQWLATDVAVEIEKGMNYTDIPGFPTSNEFYLRPINANASYVSIVSVSRYVTDNFGYRIGVKTIDSDGTGTDANIRLTLEGCSGESQTFILEDYRDNFESGYEDWFFLTGTKNLKGIKKVKLVNDKSNSHPGWSPEWLDVTPVNYVGLNEVRYVEHKDGSVEGVYNKTFHHTFSRGLNDADGWTWESDEQACPDLLNPAVNPFVYSVHPGEYAKVYGMNLDMAGKISMTLDRMLEPLLVTRDYVLFQIPGGTPLSEYVEGPVKIDGIAQPVIIKVVGEKPILDGVAVVTAKPGDAFEVSMRNIGESSSFYLGNVLLDFLGLSDRGAYVKVPRNIENGVYQFRAVSNGWDVVFDETVEIIESVVPHILSVSQSLVYTGQLVEITGKNFGTEIREVVVKIGEETALVESLSDDKITIRIPAGVSGKGIVIGVARDGVAAPELMTVDVRSVPGFMSFDDIGNPWTSTVATLLYDDGVTCDDIGYSLKVHGNGYITIISPVFNTYELGVMSDELLLDVWVPDLQVNPYWFGEVQVSINIPAAGLYNAWVGQVMLTGLNPGWNTLSFPLNWDVFSALAGDYPNATISIIMNVNQNQDDYRIDNLRFGGDIRVRTMEHVIAGTILDVYSADFMSFDNINDWESVGQSLLFIEYPRMEGLGAMGINASGYTEIKSRPFSPSDIEFVSNIISLNVYVPNPQPNDYWIGNVGLGLSCPDNSATLIYLGNVDLTHMFREEFNNVQFQLPSEAMTALRYGVGECSFSIYMNVNNGAGLFLFDNMGFVHVLDVAGRL